MMKMPMRFHCAEFSAILVVVLLLTRTVSQAPAADVIVVADDGFRDALTPWVEMRQGEGLTIAFCSPHSDRDAMATVIRGLAKTETRYVMLVGDAPSFASQDADRDRNGAAGRLVRIPTFYLPSKSTAAHGSTPTYPTDLPFGDFDFDGFNEASVGRLPVVAPEQLSGLVTRILAYERSQDFGLWRRRLQLTAGVGGFGALVDGAIESVTRTVLTSVLPPDAKPQIAYASPGHAFCPIDEPFGEAVMSRYRSGARFWVYAGHGSVDRLDFLTRASDDSGSLTPGETSRTSSDGRWRVESLLHNQNTSLLVAHPARAPIAVLLACYAGAYDAPGDCLSERMLLTPGGPIAVISASRLTMPYGNARFGLGLLEAAYQPIDHLSSAERLGDAALAAVRRLQRDHAPVESDTPVSTTQMMVDGLAALISPAGSDLAQERREHAGLYQLFGDPTLRLQRPEPLEMTIVDSEDPEPQDPAKDSTNQPSVCVRVTSPIGGTLIVCVDRPLGSVNDSSDTATHHSEGDPHRCTIGQVQLPIQIGVDGLATIPIPPQWSGAVVVRGFVQGIGGWASGATKTILLP